MSYPEEQLWDHINDGCTRMTFKQRKLWEVIKRMPEEWQLKGHGPCWVVAILGHTVIYYNHHEQGFNRSPWVRYGVIESYQTLQGELDEAVQMQLDLIEDGSDGPWTTGPLPGEYQPP